MNIRLVRWIDIWVGIPLTYLFYAVKKALGVFPLSPRRGEEAAYSRILLIKFWGIGNIAMMLPAALSLRSRYPQAKLDFLTLKRNKPVALASGCFDNVYGISSVGFIAFISSTLRKLFMLRRNAYDLVIDFEQFARFSAIFSALIARGQTIGFNTKGQHRQVLFGRAVPYDNAIHIVRSFCSLTEEAGAAPQRSMPRGHYLVSSAADIESVKRLIGAVAGSGRKMVVLHVGTSDNFTLRRWPLEYFAELADRIIEAFGATVVFSGMREESFLVKEAVLLMRNRSLAIDLSGKLNFKTFLALLSLADLTICADTAPVHLASCLNRPVVGLYGPNTPFLYGPWGEKGIFFYKSFSCSPCITNFNAKINRCRHPQGQGACMRALSVDEVFKGVSDYYLKPQARFSESVRKAA